MTTCAGVTHRQYGLLGTRYPGLARNTIDYWMTEERASPTMPELLSAMEQAPRLPESSLRLYLHVPFCAQRCRFCAFSGGNSLTWKQAERYANLLVKQLHTMWRRSALCGEPIRSVNIGGGSPDLLGASIEMVLQAVQALPGFGPQTELSVECALSTVKREFIDSVAQAGVTKISFGVQSLDPAVRAAMRQPKTMVHLERALESIDGRIAVVNADLITGLPGQTPEGVAADLESLMGDERITAISSYLLTAGAAPSLIAAVDAGSIPAPPMPLPQALMRLQTYGAFRRHGWIRRGTNTYVDPSRIEAATLATLAGDECIGGSQYETHLLGVGPQAVTSLPGVRVENLVDIEAWCAAVTNDEAPYFLPKCSTAQQRDIALWAFPLRWEGLPRAALDRMLAEGWVTPRQKQTFDALVREGLVVAEPDRYALSLLGEVFMGQLVRDLKGEAGRSAVDDYIAEGEALGRAAADGMVADGNPLNDRQRAARWLTKLSARAPLDS